MSQRRPCRAVPSLPVASEPLLVIIHELVGRPESTARLFFFFSVIVPPLQRRIRVRVVGSAERRVAHIVERTVWNLQSSNELCAGREKKLSATGQCK